MKVYGLIGKKLDHSFSLKFFNEKFKKEKISNVIYKNFEINDVKDFKQIINQTNIYGLNVTIPYKNTIFNHINEFENSCEDIGSVNCIFKGKGYNTDWKGFVLSLKKNDIDVSQKKCAIIGAGATAKSIAYALIELRCKSISIYNRTHENRISLENWIRFKIKTYNTKNYDIIINATSLGLKNGDEFDFNFEDTKKNLIYIDTIYNPLETKTLRYLKEKDIKVFNGLEMFIYQGQKAFYLWNKVNPEIDQKLIEILFAKLK